ncbi:kinase inhibitor [Entomohabitans teleogrylli]|uniref:kinase inhibitor n=1 Tax=Entomohabitans teleogrylli TaxID=1384589 RepID=UPI00073D99EE|nr:kinase inhibitor [Entomohabitans teleogrylli]
MKYISAVVLSASMSFSAQSAEPFTLTSQDIGAGNTLNENQLYQGFGCAGKNQSPQLSWSGVPEGTRSFALVAFDPDAPTGSGWWHWTVVNIPRQVSRLESGAGDRSGNQLPAGAVQGRNDFGYAGYGGACPPAGDKPHRYRFTLWALNVDRLPIDGDASGALVGFMLHNHAIARADLTAVYRR